MKKDFTPPADPELSPEADPVELPENAFRELAADENYRPLMHPAAHIPR